MLPVASYATALYEIDCKQQCAAAAAVRVSSVWHDVTTTRGLSARGVVPVAESGGNGIAATSPSPSVWAAAAAETGALPMTWPQQLQLAATESHRNREICVFSAFD